MNLMQSPDQWQVAGWIGTALLHFLWQGTLLAIVLAILLVVMKKSAATLRYAAACGTLMMMSVSPVATTVALHSRATATAIQTTPPVNSAGQIPYYRVAVQSLPEAIPAAAPIRVVGALRAADQPLSWLPIVTFGVWLVGVVILAARLLGGWLVIRRLLRGSSRPVAGPLNAAMSSLAHRLGVVQLPRLLACEGVAVPTVVGGLRSAILLPASAINGVSAQMLEALVAHELCHLKRHDYLVNLWQSAVETVLFYHPAVWWVSSVIRREREFCCDDMAIRLLADRTTYANALATLEEMRSRPLALAVSDGDLLARIRRIAKPGPRRSSSLSAALFALVLPIALVISVVGMSVRLAAPAIAAARRLKTARDLLNPGSRRSIPADNDSHRFMKPTDGKGADNEANTALNYNDGGYLFTVAPWHGGTEIFPHGGGALSGPSNGYGFASVPANGLSGVFGSLESGAQLSGPILSGAAARSAISASMLSESPDQDREPALLTLADTEPGFGVPPPSADLKRQVPETAIPLSNRTARKPGDTSLTGSPSTPSGQGGADNGSESGSKDGQPAAPSKSGANDGRTIGEIVVVGSKVLNASTVISLSGHKIGDPCTPEVVADMQSRLSKSGNFGMHHPDNAAQWVRIQAEDLPDNKCKVTITVDENDKITEITVIGTAPVKPEVVMADITKTAVFNSEQFRKDKNKIADEYNRMGYSIEFGANTGMDPTAPGRLVVTIVADRVEEIIVVKDGVKVNDPRLLRQLTTKAGGYYQRKQFYEVDRGMVIRRYRQYEPVFTETPAGPGKLRLKIRLQRIRKEDR